MHRMLLACHTLREVREEKNHITVLKRSLIELFLIKIVSVCIPRVEVKHFFHRDLNCAVTDGVLTLSAITISTVIKVILAP